MLIGAVVSASDMTTGLEVLKTVFTYLTSCVSNVVTIVLENWLLMIPIGIVLAFTVVRFVRSIFRVN